MATYNIEISYFNGTSYDTLYPLANLANVTGSLNASNLTGSLSTSQIPNLDASKITSGTFSTSRIPTINISSGTTGYLPSSRISGLSSGGTSQKGSYVGTGSYSGASITVYNSNIFFLACSKTTCIGIKPFSNPVVVNTNNASGASFGGITWSTSSVYINGNAPSISNETYYWYSLT